MAFQSSIEEISQVLHVKNATAYFGQRNAVQGVVVDSREVRPSVLFIARKGEALDGHSFLLEVAEKGAAGAVVEESWLAGGGPELVRNGLLAKGNKAEFPLLAVQDTTRALGELARFWRDRISRPTLCISGSTGKTSTKELLRSILSQVVGQGTANEKSLNNHVGLPQTILGADEKTKWLVLEAGMNHAGELDYLGNIAHPHVALLLNIGPAHIEFFGSLARIADAKCELLQHVVPNGKAIIFADDYELEAGLERAIKQRSFPLTVIRFGSSAAADFRLLEYRSDGSAGSSCIFSIQGKKVKARIPFVGKHQAINALAALTAAIAAFPEIQAQEFAEALESAANAPMRMELLKCGKVTVINDCYNANPVSMQAALETARELALGKNLVLVLGEMRELGEHAERYHQELGRAVALLHPTRLIALGEQASVLVTACRQSGCRDALEAHDHQEAAQLALHALGDEEAVLLVKGSRVIALEHVVQLVLERLNALSSVFFAS